MFGLRPREFGIDLGTANTIVYDKGKGIIVREPTVIAINKNTKEVVAVGSEAKKMLGRTPGSIEVTRPMKNGVIADYETTVQIIKHNLNIASKRASFFKTKPNVMVCIPSGVTSVEKRAVEDATKAAGAKIAYTITEPFAAAVGAGMPVWEATGNMVIDIGGGTTEVAVISLGGIVTSQSLRVAGDKMDDAISFYIRKRYNLFVGERTAENIKLTLGTADKGSTDEKMEIKGRDLLTGLPKTLEISSAEVATAVADSVNSIIDTIHMNLEKTPPELAADIINRGIVLTGGGALLRDLDKVISRKIDIPVFVADNPLDCVALGTGKVLEELLFVSNNSRIKKQVKIRV